MTTMDGGPRPAQRPGVAEIFWRAAGVATAERTPDAVVRQALISIAAFDEGAVISPKTRKPMSLMELLADLGIEENLVYASPELARGESIDERSLVFTIGVLIFERLTERHPFGTPDNPERVARIRRCEMGSGVNFFPSVPKELRTILMRSMGPFPEERYRGLQQLKEDLARFVGQPHLAAARARPDRPAASGDSRHHPRPPSSGAGLMESGGRFMEAPTVVRLPSSEEEDAESDASQSADDKFGTDDETTPSPARDQHAAPAASAPQAPAGSALGAPPPHRLAARLLSSPGAAPPLPQPPGKSKEQLDDEEILRAIPTAMPERDILHEGRVPLLVARRPSRWDGYSLGAWAPVIYGLLGAGIASLVFLIIFLGRPRPPRPSARPAATRPATGTGPKQVRAKGTGQPAPVAAKLQPRPEPQPKKPPASEPRPAAAASEPKKEPAVSSVTEPEPKKVAKVDPAPETDPPASRVPTPALKTDPTDPPEIVAGLLVAQAIRPCGVAQSGARSLRVAAYVKDGKVARALSNKKQGITDRQIACLQRQMVPLELPLPWPELSYIEWSVRIFPDHVEATVAAPAELKARIRQR